MPLRATTYLYALTVFVVLNLCVADLAGAQFCESLFRTEVSAANEAAISQLTPQERLRRIGAEFDIPADSFKRRILEMFFEKKFVHQFDPRLYRRGLIRENGGLCGPVCVSNLLAVIEREAASVSTPEHDPIDRVERVVRTISHERRKDARYSTNSGDLAVVLERFKLRRNLPEAYVAKEKATPGRFSDLRLGADTVAFMMLAAQGRAIGHWVILLDINAVTREALIIDPESDEYVFRLAARERGDWVEFWSERLTPRANRFDPANWLRSVAVISVHSMSVAGLKPEMHERYRR